jgi:hypothetical protein
MTHYNVLRQTCDVCSRVVDTVEGTELPKGWLTREKIDVCDNCIAVEKAGGGNVKSTAAYLYVMRK